MKVYTWWWQVKSAKTFNSWQSCETWRFSQACLQCWFLCIRLCLLFVVSDFLLVVVCQEGACDGKMLVLFYAFVGLHFMNGFSTFGCALFDECSLWCGDYLDATRMWWEGFKWKWIDRWGVFGLGNLSTFSFKPLKAICFFLMC